MPKNSNKLSQFWQELKRRKVIHVIVVYTTAAFALIDLVSNITEPLNLPEWTLTLIIILLLVGFPVAVIFSWIFDVTPEGIEKTKPAEKLHKDEIPKTPNSWRIATFVSVVVIAGLVALNLFPRSKDKAATKEEFDNSIAVLSFINDNQGAER